MKRIVVALGGNALGSTPEEQLHLVKLTSKPIVDLIEKGNEVIIAHGNGPQVGMINLAFETSSQEIGTPEMPFPECGAMSQGYIGFHLQNSIQTELANRGIKKQIATIITQVEVAPDDPAFFNPSKPIGSFYSKEQADLLEKEKNYTMREDAGRGYRRVVPSPLPIDVIEIDVVKTLVKAGHIVITVGGGGIPVVRNNKQLNGVAAVIDKDFASSKLAELLDADYLFILTAVPKVSLHYNTPKQIDLDELSVEDAERYIKENHFARGSMLPKIQAASLFAKSKKGRIALIASLKDAALALEGKTGTKITL